MNLIEIPTTYSATNQNESHNNLFETAYANIHNSNIGSLTRQCGLIVQGTISGAIKELANDPVTALEHAGACAIGAAALGLAASSQNKLLAGGALVTGAALTGKWLYDIADPNSAENAARNATILQAIQETGASDDPLLYRKNLARIESAIGPTVLDLGLGLAAGAGGHALRVHAAPKFRNYFDNVAKDFAPSASFSTDGAPASYFADINSYLADYILFAKSKHGRVTKYTDGTLRLPIERVPNLLSTRPNLSSAQRQIEADGRPGDAVTPYFYFGDRAQQLRRR